MINHVYQKFISNKCININSSIIETKKILAKGISFKITFCSNKI